MCVCMCVRVRRAKVSAKASTEGACSADPEASWRWNLSSQPAVSSKDSSLSPRLLTSPDARPERALRGRLVAERPRASPSATVPAQKTSQATSPAEADPGRSQPPLLTLSPLVVLESALEDGESACARSELRNPHGPMREAQRRPAVAVFDDSFLLSPSGYY